MPHSSLHKANRLERAPIQLSRRLSRIFRNSVVLLIMIGSIAVVHARSPLYRQYEIKAAFLYKFALFVKWPDQEASVANTPIRVGLLGGENLGWQALESIAGKSIRGRPIAIQRFMSVKELEYCHILFIDASQKEDLTSILESVKGLSVLTVSDMERFAQSGGIINLVVKKNKMQFEVNLAAAKRVSLKLSSELLKIATIVNQDS